MVLQTGEGWNAGVNPKAMGGRNLDAATRQLPHLEHFVMFSSYVASAGNEGGFVRYLLRGTKKNPRSCAVISF